MTAAAAAQNVRAPPAVGRGAGAERSPRRGRGVSRGLAEGAAEHRWRRGRSAYRLLCQTATIIIWQVTAARRFGSLITTNTETRATETQHLIR